jgi:hypothetical protein
MVPVTVTRACTGKRKHRSAARAEKHRQRLIGQGTSPTAVETYQCKHCSTTAQPIWHVGHAKNRMKWRVQ